MCLSGATLFPVLWKSLIISSMQYHGALHCHSNYSYDAKLSLRELKELFVERGLSFVFMSEHTDEMTHERAATFVRECRELSDSAFVFVPGFEISYKDTHILAPGCGTFLSQHPTEDELRAWRREAPLFILAHPHRNGYQTRVPEGMFDGIEIWNAQYDGKLVPRTGARALFQKEREKHHALSAFAGWDFHRESHAGGPLISVESGELTEAALMSALRTRSYTLRSLVVEIQPDGTLSGGDERWVRALSFGYVQVIRVAKVVNRVLAWFGLKLPKKLVARVRSRL